MAGFGAVWQGWQVSGIHPRAEAVGGDSLDERASPGLPASQGATGCGPSWFDARSLNGEPLLRNDAIECGVRLRADRHDCPDCLIDYWPNGPSYGIMIHDGGSSMITIAYCPWCGTKLPSRD